MGRQTHHLSELPLEGNGQIVMRDVASGKVIYTTSFSSLFQEWLETDEAKEVTKGFENTYLLPYPIKPAEVEITLRNNKREVSANLKHVVKPNDILIHKKGLTHITPHKYLLKSGNEEQCIDVAILAEGYTTSEMETFYKDAAIACEALFSHEPFQSMKNRFNIVAVASPSADSGVSAPKQEHGSTRPSAPTSIHSIPTAMLTTSRVKAINDALAGIPYEHIIILGQYGTIRWGRYLQCFHTDHRTPSQFPSGSVHEFRS